MDVLITILNDIWQGLLNFESGFIVMFLGIGAILVALIQQAVAIFGTDPA
ncbi:MAG: hypothetical protein WCQ69_02505 [Bacteroidales bacterium]|jgi:hypothetical protein|nr:hypothetical protein [Bacteroidales bacterium]MDD4168188.1 hypothetical protein [Bacteroidales bacterium]MDD5047084.1 hypothetical protein [Bacteroidales bacterium]MDY0353416.1 hypothetical protein [Bacteroidales bacterium]HHV02803.1 hypothetical protein [Bacteroidales bacterium]